MLVKTRTDLCHIFILGDRLVQGTAFNSSRDSARSPVIAILFVAPSERSHRFRLLLLGLDHRRTADPEELTRLFDDDHFGFVGIGLFSFSRSFTLTTLIGVPWSI